MFNEHSRHVVRRALRLSERNEIVKAFFRALTRAHGAANFVVRRGDDKAVRAEENFVPLGERDLERVAERVFVWAERAGVPIVKQKEGADPAAVVFDGIQAAKQRGADVLIVDTAGRLHNKSHLMEELKKMARVISREFPEAKTRSLLVIDATTGQNGLAQAEVFKDVADLEGIILTKLDGTAKGGIAIAIRSELGLPVRYIGVGEQLDDLRPFDAKEFIDAIL